ncbi:MAG: hypothetical protein CVT80_13080 [Alphaproteobacteria bacterium HGW-Alphaproteobacteria-2]|nr:MAG: hypothetical protein CVT80_13080 [Alphaproteobacteria bacterium HGW-Alphaproteobacteria-2]
MKVTSLIVLFTAWFFGNIYVLYRTFRNYHEHGVPMASGRIHENFIPWWNWKYMNRAFLWAQMKIGCLWIILTVTCLFLAIQAMKMT